jgi:hypothetical protein
MSSAKVTVKPITSASDVKLEIGENKKNSASNGNYNSYNITYNSYNINGIYKTRAKGNENEQKRARLLVVILFI